MKPTLKPALSSLGGSFPLRTPSRLFPFPRLIFRPSVFTTFAPAADRITRKRTKRTVARSRQEIELKMVTNHREGLQFLHKNEHEVMTRKTSIKNINSGRKGSPAILTVQRHQEHAWLLHVSVCVGVCGWGPRR